MLGALLHSLQTISIPILMHAPGSLRRRLLIAALAAPLAHCASNPNAPERGPVVLALPGPTRDEPPIDPRLTGLARAERELKVTTRNITNLTGEPTAQLDALREIARSDAKLVITAGDSMAVGTQRIGWEFPLQRFAVLQGDAEYLRPNVAVYRALGEQSAWLAGAFAGLRTERGTVGHVGGTRGPEALAARAAFAAGLAAARPGARLLTHFIGDDDATRARSAALALLEAGVDPLFVDLNVGMNGALAAARGRGIRLIGATQDWVAHAPADFSAAAVADQGTLVFAVARDLVDAVWRGDLVRRFGLRQPETVRLALAREVPGPLRARLEEFRDQLMAGRITIPGTYSGPEFSMR